MKEEEALKILGITSLSDCDIVKQAKQQLNELYKSNFTMLPRFLEKDNTGELLKKIKACKSLTEGQPDQAKVFSDLVISVIDDDKPGFLKLLLKTVENDDKFNYLNTEGTGGNIPLNFALGYTYKHESRIKAITLLLEHGADPNTKNREGKSPLHCVINNSNGVFCHKITELLLNYNASPDAIDNQGKTLLHYLFEDRIHDRVEIAKLLLKRGANPYIQNGHGESLLYKAYSEKRDDIVKLLLECDTNFGKGEHVQSLLCKACSEGRSNIVKLLLKHGADPNVQNEHGEFLLYKACSERRDSIVRLLLEHKADPNIKDQKGKTPLSFVFEDRSLRESNVGIVELLLEYGASPDVKDQKGKSLFYYIINGHSDIDCYEGIVKLLLDKGVSPNIQDSQGKTPLHYLCEHGYRKGSVEIAKLLLRRGADPDLKDKDSEKPIDLVSPHSDVGKLFGAIDYNKAIMLGVITLLATTSSVALISGVADVYIGAVWCSALAAAMAAVALCCACCAVKTLFFSAGPSTEFTEARAEFLNSQKIA